MLKQKLIFSENFLLDNKISSIPDDSPKKQIISQETVEDSNVTERLKKERLEKTKK